MKIKILLFIVLFLSMIGTSGYAQSTITESGDSLIKKLADALDELSDYYVMKVENTKHKVETLEGDDITSEVSAIKSPNGLDLVFYDPETNWTSICYDFFDNSTPNNEWLPTDYLPKSPTGLHWVLTNNFKSFYFVQNGSYMDMANFSLKKSESNPNEYIVQENGVDKYVMKELKGKNQDEFYPLELLK